MSPELAGEITKKVMPLEIIEQKILLIRGHKVILDSDLAELYGVETKVLNQAVRRNILRFPGDFMFELDDAEHEALRSQFVTLKKGRGQHTSIFLTLSLSRALPCSPACSTATERLR